MKPEQLCERIRGTLPDAHFELSGSDCSFEILVVSERLSGLGTLARQRLVLGLFRAEFASGELHALSVRAHTPNEVAEARSSQL